MQNMKRLLNAPLQVLVQKLATLAAHDEKKALCTHSDWVVRRFGGLDAGCVKIQQTERRPSFPLHAEHSFPF